jgi:hypothetical protein
MNKYKTFEELKEELGDKFEEYMYKANLELLEMRDKAIEYIETHQLNFKKGITTFGRERLSMEERKLLDILQGEDTKESEVN